MLVAVVVLGVVCAGVLVGVRVFLASCTKRAKAMLMARDAASEGLAEAALMIDRADSAVEPTVVWFEKLLGAQLALSDEVGRRADDHRYSGVVDWWLRVELDLGAALSQQVAERTQRGMSLGDTAMVDEMKVLVEAVVDWNRGLTSNLRRLRTEGCDDEAVAALGNCADERLKLVYQNNGWPLLSTSPGLRWPGEPLGDGVGGRFTR